MRCKHWKECFTTDPEQRMKGLIFREPAETGERLKGNESGINTGRRLGEIRDYGNSTDKIMKSA